MNLLFWNIKRNDVSEYICDCIRENDIDIAAFAEHEGVDFSALGEMLADEYRTGIGNGGCEKVRILAKRGIDVRIRMEQARYIVFAASVDGADYVLSALHMRDQRNYETEVRVRDGEEVMNAVRNAADNEHCNNIILMGDFNANPYDREMLLPNSFNAVLFKDVIAKSESCTFCGKRYKRLYNPVLNFISEDSKTYGSYYLGSAGKAIPVWNCLDMVLVSKPLVDRVSSVSYPRFIAGKSLMNNVKPNPDISDHLPLLVRID